MYLQDTPPLNTIIVIRTKQSVYFEIKKSEILKLKKNIPQIWQISVTSCKLEHKTEKIFCKLKVQYFEEKIYILFKVWIGRKEWQMKGSTECFISHPPTTACWPEKKATPY